MLEAIFLDTSVLLPGLIDYGPAARPAQAILAAVAEGRLSRPHTAWHCCLEFFSVSTRLPPELRLAPADAALLVLTEILARFTVHQMPEGRFSDFFTSAGAEGLAGGRIYDGHIAEVARLSGARTVVTDNLRHFGMLARHGIRLLKTRDFAATAGL
ncbi:MAG TPA: PIN domain-containing protein [Candidatus Nitrosotenuis sp.]|nr:PIN domain-containing protein [Candidatus Nitrosotenuis sp.]